MKGQHFVSQLVVGICVALGPAGAAAGTELIVKNDSMTDASSVTPCLCFVKGDIPAAWLTSPADGRIVGVQIFWKSDNGGAFDRFEDFIRIFDGSTFPEPGAVLVNDSGDDAVVTGPITLSDGVLNEFRFLDQAQTIPMGVPVSAGQTFAVGLQVVNQSSGGDSFTPSLTYDNDGCQSGKNGAFINASEWIDVCPQGVTGDWVIRAIIEPTPNACCLGDKGQCVMLSEPECDEAGGVSHSDKSCAQVIAEGLCVGAIPAVSQWGLALIALLTLVCATVVLRNARRRLA